MCLGTIIGGNLKNRLAASDVYLQVSKLALRKGF